MPKLALAFDVTANTSQASRKLDQLGNKVESTGKRVRGLTGTVGRPLLALAGAGGVGALIGSSVKLAASFETTMRQIAVATNTTAAPEIKKLSDLALKMGAATTFSAKEAGDAMLDLAKGGLSAAQIKAGALSSTLTLAAAGGLDLGEAAGFVVQGLSTFNLKADKAAEVAAALAGGANASTASVQDMGLALAQVGPGALNAGLSLQETTAVLAEFAQNGIKGSDAGTALKTMLTRLVPTTKQAKTEMNKLGLRFVDAHGNFKSISSIADLLHDKLGKLSAAQRSAALSTIFGSDASRAATVLAKEGAAGLAKYIKATNDKTQADKLAKAATSGTAGALEQMRGSIETAQIALGTALAPAVVDIAKKISNFASGPLTKDVIPAISKFVQGMEHGKGPGGDFAHVLGDVGDAAKGAWSVAKPMLSFIGDHPKLFTEVAKDALIFAGAMKAIGAVKKLPGLGALLGGGRPGKGGILGSVTKAAPLPVFVTNSGFGGPGGLPGSKGKGKIPKIPVAPVAARSVALGIGSVLLTSGDSGPLIGRQKEWHDFVVNLNKLIKVERGTSKEANEQSRLLGKAFNKGGRADLVAVYDLLTKYGKKTGEVKAKIADLAKDPTVVRALRERAEAVNRNILLISGGFLNTEKVAKSSAAHMGQALGSGVADGVGYAMRHADELNERLDRLGAKKPRPKIDLNSKPAIDKNNELLHKLYFLDGFKATPDVRLHGADAATAKMKHLIALLTKVPDASVTVTVHDLVTGGLPARAGGGKVLRNGAYLVGEREPEVFVPDRNGQVLNQKQMAAAGIGSGTTVNLYGGITVQDNKTALSVPDQLRQSLWIKGL